MIFLRSLLFNLCFFLWSMLAALIFSPLFLCSSKAAQKSGNPWAWGVLFLARVICGIRFEIRGREYILSQPCIYASKHQSAWDTIIFHIIFAACPAFVLKRELRRIPLWGWYLWRMQMIAIDRAAGASSIKSLVKQSKEALADGRPILIFPEGTRTRPGAEPHYHPGILALYNQLKVPVVPVALNSGFYWGKNAFIKRPGTIILEFLPAISSGLAKEEFMQRLQNDVETASQRLLKEAQSANQKP